LSGAIVDGWFLPTDIYTIYAQGKQNDLVLVTGGTNDEGGNLPAVGGAAPPEGRAGAAGPAGRSTGAGEAGEGGGRGGRGGAPTTLSAYRAWAERTVGPRAPELLRLYSAATDADVAKAYHDLSRDVNFAGHRTWAKLQVTTGKQPAYVYMFSHIAPNPQGNGNSPPPMRGAVHFSDVPFAFSNLRMWDYPWREIDWKVADTMTTYWTNIAKNLNPNGPGLVNWPTYNPGDEAWMNLDATMRVEKFSSARMDFIARIQEENRTRP
jgi:para-nitrobenzyl esterase